MSENKVKYASPEAEERARLRIMEAMNENRVLCTQCNVRFQDYHVANLAQIRAGGWGGINLRACKMRMGCHALAAVRDLQQGPEHHAGPLDE